MRKAEIVQIDEGSRETNRDFGKKFLLTEMPALQAEKWAARAFLALARSGLDLPEEVTKAGFAGVAFIGLRALATGGIVYAEIEPLLDEMLACVRILPDPAHPELSRPLVLDHPEGENDVDEVSTLLLLRTRVFALHTDFFVTGGR